ncbi:MAG: hypothetical protein ACRC68_10140 [Clostridium sp.]
MAYEDRIIINSILESLIVSTICIYFIIVILQKIKQLLADME